MGPVCRDLLLFAGCAALAACSAPSEPEPGAPSRTSSHGRIQVAVVVGQAEAPRIEAQVRLLRYHDVDAETADILAGDQAHSSLDVGRCEIRTAEARLDRALDVMPERAGVEHLDAGEIRVQWADLAAGSVAPRDLPALFPYVTGVEYSALEATTDFQTGLARNSDVSATAFGGIDIGPFNVVATVPDGPGPVRATVSDELLVEWAGRSDEGFDEALIVSVSGADDGPQLRCRAADTGRLIIYPRVLEGVSRDAHGSLTVAIERLRRVPFAATGISVGELEVAVRYVVTASPL